MARRRVVVTGMGVVTPLGLSVDRFWDLLIKGQSGAGPITLFDASAHDVRIAAECSEFDPSDKLDRKVFRRLDRFAQFSLVSAQEAYEDSGLDMSVEDPSRACVVVGSGIGGMIELEEQHLRLQVKGPAKVSAFTIPKLMINAASANISIMFGTKGPSMAVASACASATNAIGHAFQLVRSGAADMAFAGGSEAAVTPLSIAAFASMKALSSRNDDPCRASRPFDRDRDGFLLGEGAGTVILEDLEHAKKRGAKIHAEVLGFGCSSDAGHITQPTEDGEGAATAMENALSDGGVSADRVNYVNAHGTGTPLGDKAEMVAIKRVFAAHAEKLVVSSTKSSIGHLLGASGAVELIAAISAIERSVIPPTINLENPDEGCDLDLCPNTARETKVDVAISNSFGFGGHDACIIVGAFKD